MILKLLLLIGVIAAVYFLFFKPKSVKKPSGGSGSKPDESNEMVACSKCGTYVPVNDAFIKNGNYYCSDECMHS